MTFLASCSKEESVTLTPIIESDNPGDEREDFFFLNASNSPFQTAFNSAYVSCQFGDSTLTHTHILAYGIDLEVLEDQSATFTDLNFLTWTTNEPLTSGEYLAAGFSEELDSTILFDLFINYDNGKISGEFISHDESLGVSGYFQTSEYTCEQLLRDMSFSTELSEGRITHTTDGHTEIQTAVSTFCNDISIGGFGEVSFNIILAGGAAIIEEGGLLPEIDPDFLLFTQFDETFELGKTYSALFLPEPKVDLQNIEELLSILQETEAVLAITFLSLDNGFAVGQYSGTDVDGRSIEGQFRAELYACN